MSDYTKTPNLGLFKPTYDADEEMWGNHLNSNSDVLDTVLLGGGPFLPLSGGTMTGSIRSTYAQDVSSQGGAYRGFTVLDGSISGVRTGGEWQISLLQLSSDTMDAGGGGFVGQYINLNSGGGTTSGNRVGQYINTYFSGSTLDGVRGYPSQYGGQWIYAHASGNAGGTSLGASRGQLWGGLSSATLQAGATFWSYAIAHEFNVGVSTGASAAFVQGLKVAIQNHNQTNDPGRDFLMGLARVALSDMPFYNGFVFGTVDGYWPIASGGTLIGTQASVLPTPPAQVAAHGIDFSNVTFGADAFKSPGFLINPNGGLDFEDGVASSATDLSRHIRFHSSGYGISVSSGSLNAVAGSQIAFYLNGAQAAFIDGNGVHSVLPLTATLGAFTSVAVGGSSGPTWTTGAAAPAATAPVGSLYSQTGGAVGATLYVSRGGGSWSPVAGV